MKKIYLITSLLLVSKLGWSQHDTTLDQLQVPTSPAFTMLGISPENIERPKNPTDFALSLGNVTSGFTTIPKDYAVEFSPFWIFNKKRVTFEKFKQYKNVGNNILQTATISAGTTTGISQIDSSAIRKTAVALKFSIFRGRLDSDFIKWGDSVTAALTEVAVIKGRIRAKLNVDDIKRRNQFKQNILQIDSEEQKAITRANAAGMTPADLKLFTDSLKHVDTIYRKMWADSINIWDNTIQARADKMDEIAEKLSQDSVKEYISRLKSLQAKTDFKRVGFKLDFALGTAMDYPDSTFQTCYVSKASGWLTGGYESKDGLNFLGVLRYSENFNRFFLNDNKDIVSHINMGEFDYGFRLYKDFASKLTLSAEYIQRIALYNKTKFDDNKIKRPINSDRFVISINYKVGKNQNLAFTYGKNFDNTYIKQNNLITALNFIIGFGSTRPVAD